MGIEYFCCYHSYKKKCEKLSDQELGRLFRALLEYSESGAVPDLAGRESIAFDFIADDIDRAKDAYAQKCSKNAANAASGARSRWKENNGSENSERQRTAANGSENSERHFPIANDGENGQNKYKYKYKDKDNKRILSSPYNPPSCSNSASTRTSKTDDEDDGKEKKEIEELFRLWDQASGKVMSRMTSESLVELLHTYGLARLSDAIRIASDRDAVNLSYVRAVLEGRGKKGKGTKKTVPKSDNFEDLYSGKFGDIYSGKFGDIYKESMKD